jgi:uncharacterized protein DUF3606
VEDNPYSSPQDRTLIDVNQHRQMRYWAKFFGVDEKMLRSIVRQVGAAAGDVRRCIEARRAWRRKRLSPTN